MVGNREITLYAINVYPPQPWLKIWEQWDSNLRHLRYGCNRVSGLMDNSLEGTRKPHYSNSRPLENTLGENAEETN